MMKTSGKNLSASFSTHYIITDDITISDLDDPNLDFVFPLAYFIGAKGNNAGSTEKVTITIKLSQISDRKQNRNVDSFIRLFKYLKLIDAKNFFSGITITVEPTNIVNIWNHTKSFDKIDTFSSKDYAYQDIPAGNMFGEIILTRTDDRSAFTEFSPNYPIYTYEYVEDTTSGSTDSARSTRRKSEVYEDWVRI